MHDICMLVNAKNILEWHVLSVNLAAAKLQNCKNEGRLLSGPLAPDF